MRVPSGIDADICDTGDRNTIEREEISTLECLDIGSTASTKGSGIVDNNVWTLHGRTILETETKRVVDIGAILFEESIDLMVEAEFRALVLVNMFVRDVHNARMEVMEQIVQKRDRGFLLTKQWLKSIRMW